MTSTRTVAELAALVGGQLRGDGALSIEGVADLKSARPGQISFLGNRRYLPAARATKAGAVVLGEDDPDDFPFAQIRVAKPSIAFAQIVAVFAPSPLAYEPGVHPSAVIAPGVKLGEGVSVQPQAVIEAGAVIGARSVIGAGCFVGRDVTLGDDCLLYPRVVVRERSRLGNRVTLHSGAVIGADGFGYEFQGGRHVKIPQIGYVQIDDDVEIGANSTVDRGRFDRTWIQTGAKIDNLVQIAHNVTVGPHCIVVAQTGISGSTSLGAYVTLAGQVGTVGHIHIGDQATVTAQSGVSKDVPPKTVVAGHHAIPIKESLKLEAMVRRLPELLERVRDLEKRASV